MVGANIISRYRPRDTEMRCVDRLVAVSMVETSYFLILISYIGKAHAVDVTLTLPLLHFCSDRIFYG